MKVLLCAVLTVSSFSAFASWDKIKPSADFRYRLENTKDEFKDEGQSRQRIRARVGLDYEVDNMTQIKLRLATTGGATGTNDTLGNSEGDAGEVYFDRAYLAHKAGDVNLNMGRMKNPMYRAGKNQLIWDSDLNPEGIHASYKWKGVYTNLASFWYEENKATSTNDGLDVTITSSQLGYMGDAGDFKYNIGASNYHYENAHAAGTFGDEGINILETFLELKYRAFTLYYSGTTNNEAEDYNKANIVGISYGKTKDKGTWIVGFNQRTVELNALNSKLMDSDFAGQTTDTTGSIAWGKYMLTDKSYLSFGYFQNTKNADEKADATKDAEAYNKLQVDYGVKF